ncbi:DUF2357 domain-containing protein [Methanobacterium aggregans]|uniref:DUF2357 domain-containing protein n=1 Tax=Methanobacterium aggregans TaxID=1615586 RepID=UPI001AE0FBC7|nr:DUF2357 domain-containing protein [Methanobacterium aggregans]MBP2046732.1 putative component of viral defense system (DUF524 family) [Methanobacterium aggregans]
MVEQRVLIHLQDKKGNELGLLTISAITNGLKNGETFKKGFLTLENVPLVEKPDDETPIQYHSNNELNDLSKLMLLEETKYQVLFETQIPFEDEPKVLKTIQQGKAKIFEELRFKISSDESYKCAGILNFHSYVGKSFFDVEMGGVESVPCPFEVRSKKIGYLDHYPAMIGDLSEVASGMIYEMDSPLAQYLEFHRKPKETLYEDFMFLEYLFRLENLPTAYEYIKRNMYSLLESYVEVVPASFASNLGPSEMLDVISRPEHLFKSDDTPKDWPSSLKGYVPDTITQRYHHETIDTSENRFLKYFLELLDKLIEDLIKQLLELKDEGYVLDELYKYQRIVQDYLSEKWVRNVGKLNYLPLNSQVIQKREGYRDIFKYFIQFEFSFRLQWDEVEDRIKGYERKLSELYEYWCYFKLIKVLNKLSNQKLVYTDIYKISKDKWSIKVKRGRDSLQKFNIKFNDREITLNLMYNRLFSQNTKYKSYSLPFRPDYTIFIEFEGETYFVHFDAKYKSEGRVLDFYEKIGSNLPSDEIYDAEEELVNERDAEEQISRKYKYGDVYKMHTYKDAILFTEGAYVLYPGDEERIFHEISSKPIPSVGAFPLTPGKDGVEEENLLLFIKAILKNILER